MAGYVLWYFNWKNLKFHYFKWIIKNQEKTSFFDIFSFIYI